MYVAIREVMLKAVNENPWQALKELGVSAMEIELGRDCKTINFPGNEGKVFDLSLEEGIASFSEGLSKNGISHCAFLMHNDFDTGNLEEEIKWTVEVCEIAKNVGVKAVRIDLATHSEETKPDIFIPQSTTAVRKILALTENTGVNLGMENHGRLANEKEFLDKILQNVDSERLGLTLDTGNFYWYGYPLSEIYGIMSYYAGKIKHTHVKNIKYPLEKREIKREIGWEYGKFVSPIYEGDIDHQKVISILKEAGYTGDITIEDESLSKFPGEEQKGILKKDVEYLQEIIG